VKRVDDQREKKEEIKQTNGQERKENERKEKEKKKQDETHQAVVKTCDQDGVAAHRYEVHVRCCGVGQAQETLPHPLKHLGGKQERRSGVLSE
jgi:hypothetical protein